MLASRLIIVWSLLFPLPLPFLCAEETTINEIRSAVGVPLLAENALLEESAGYYAATLLKDGKLSHIDSEGRRAADRAASVGIPGLRVGEILGAAREKGAIIEAWKKSPSHLTVIEKSTWLQYGEGIARNDKTTVWVVLFTDGVINNFDINSFEDSTTISGDSVYPLDKCVILFKGDIIEPLYLTTVDENFTITLPNKQLPAVVSFGRMISEEAFRITDTMFVSLP